ncbi:MAG: tagaturonate epimerase family protein [bacterium]
MNKKIKQLTTYSMGVGDRFGQQGRAQIKAFQRLLDERNVKVSPVWNKSNREHTIIGTQPETVRCEADAAARDAKWTLPYYVDADHISLKNVDAFLAASDFFTLDVADFMGVPPDWVDVADFVMRHEKLCGSHKVEGLIEPVILTRFALTEIASKTLFAIRQAGKLYRHIVEKKGSADFVTEVSMDETLQPQSPMILLVILAAIAEEKIPAQTIAPKFTGRFNKGVDYVGDPEVFGREFDADACVVRYAARRFGLPESLKLSIHSGSDKFSLYPYVAETLRTRGVGVHLKTAGTTWLEEVVGLAAAGGEGLAVAKEIYVSALPRFDELCAPYATVIDIRKERLPRISDIEAWDAEHFVSALQHVQSNPRFNPDFRQFLHVSFKVAAKMGSRYLDAVKSNEAVVSRQVTDNIYERHLLPVFGNLDVSSHG